MDIGGIGFGPDATDVFMEGLYIPILKLADQGKMNETLMAMIRANTRLPVDTEGDVYSLAACNDVGCPPPGRDDGRVRHRRRSTRSAEHIIDRSREAVLAEIAKLPKGTWHNTMTVDGYDEPITLAATLDHLRRAASMSITPAPAGVARAASTCRMPTPRPTPCSASAASWRTHIPNNAGSLAPLTVSAPDGAILNAPKPAPVASRHVIGQMLPDVVFGCLRQASPIACRPKARRACGTSTCAAHVAGGDGGNYGFAMTVTCNGGTGARPTKDGLSATAYPSRRARHAGRDRRDRRRR